MYVYIYLSKFDSTDCTLKKITRNVILFYLIYLIKSLEIDNEATFLQVYLKFYTD